MQAGASGAFKTITKEVFSGLRSYVACESEKLYIDQTLLFTAYPALRVMAELELVPAI